MRRDSLKGSQQVHGKAQAEMSPPIPRLAPRTMGVEAEGLSPRPEMWPPHPGPFLPLHFAEQRREFKLGSYYAYTR